MLSWKVDQYMKYFLKYRLSDWKSVKLSSTIITVLIKEQNEIEGNSPECSHSKSQLMTTSDQLNK